MTTKIENTATMRTENTDGRARVLPAAPTYPGELSDEELERLAGGFGNIGSNNIGCFNSGTGNVG